MHLIGSLDESGYLRRDVDAIVDDLAFTQNVITDVEHVKNMLKIIQHFDPPGVGARNLQECLLIQIRKKEEHTLELRNAEEILENYFDAFTKKHYSKITEGLGISDEELKGILEEILKLNPKPGNSLSDSAKVVQHVVPDFNLTIDEGEISLTLNGRNAPELKVSKQYADMMKGYKAQKKSQVSLKKMR